MRIMYGFIALIAWLALMAAVDPEISNEFALMTSAIVVAGAMAGGD